MHTPLLITDLVSRLEDCPAAAEHFVGLTERIAAVVIVFDCTIEREKDEIDRPCVQCY